MDVHSDTLEDSIENGDSGADDQAGEGVRLVLRLRPPVAGVSTALVDRLGRLRAEGTIEAFDVECWPDEVSISGDGHPEVVAAFRRYERWAERNGVSVRPAFDVRSVSPLVGARRELLRLPAACLAAYEDGDLAGVFPCTDGDHTWTVEDCLDACADTGTPPTVP